MRKELVAVLMAVSLALTLAGCATTGGKSAEKSVRSTLDNWKASVEKKDIDAILTSYSDNFKSDRGDGKAGLKTFLEQAKSQGYLDGAKIDLSKTAVKIEKDKATASPIELSGSQGSIMLDLELQKEGKVWRIVKSDTN